MSQNETIEFYCPSCNTGLKIPSSLAGVTGPCPHCQTSITAPQLAPAAASVHQGQAVDQQQAPPVQAAAPAPKADIPSRPAPSAEPQKQEASAPAQPQQKAAPVEKAQTQKQPKRKIWPAFLFPLLFLVLALAVVYLILDLLGIIDFGNKAEKVDEPTPITDTPTDPSGTLPITPVDPTEQPLLIDPVPATSPGLPTPAAPAQPTAPELPATPEQPATAAQPQPIKHDPQDVKKQGEVSSDLPDLAAAKSDASVKKTTAAIKEAREVLKRFLLAQTFEERKPFITKSDRTDEELAASSLGKPFPKSFSPGLLTVRERTEDRSFEVFFSVGFEQPETDRARIILVRTVTYSDEEAPKIHTDPFIDLFEETAKKFQDEKTEGTATFSSIVGFTAYCFDDIPKASSMAKVKFYTNLAQAEKAIATAYLSKESKAFKELTRLSEAKKRIPATISVAWDTETDPKKPYLQVIRVEAINWTL